jgi:hypothetical protein
MLKYYVYIVKYVKYRKFRNFDRISWSDPEVANSLFIYGSAQRLNREYADTKNYCALIFRSAAAIMEIFSLDRVWGLLSRTPVCLTLRLKRPNLSKKVCGTKNYCAFLVQCTIQLPLLSAKHIPEMSSLKSKYALKSKVTMASSPWAAVEIRAIFDIKTALSFNG